MSTLVDWMCQDCGPTDDYYMVRHELWQQYGVGKEMLCTDCFEKRIGRKLVKSDFIACQANDAFFERRTDVL